MAGQQQTALVCEVLMDSCVYRHPPRPCAETAARSSLGGMPAATVRGEHLKQIPEKLAQIANKPAKHAGNPAPPFAAIDIKDLNRQAMDAAARRANRHNPKSPMRLPSCIRKPVPRCRGSFPSRTTILRCFPARPTAPGPFKPSPNYTVNYSALKRPPRRPGAGSYAAGLSHGVDSNRSTRKSSMERRISGICRREA